MGCWRRRRCVWRAARFSVARGQHARCGFLLCRSISDRVFRRYRPSCFVSGFRLLTLVQGVVIGMFRDARISAFGSRVGKHGLSQSLGSFCRFVLHWTNERRRALALLLPLVGEAAWSVLGVSIGWSRRPGSGRSGCWSGVVQLHFALTSH
jgi:hypothetical protein